MPLQTSGAIDIQDIATEFGGSTPHGLNEYYGVDGYTGVPSSGEIALDDFYGATTRSATVTVRPDTTAGAERHGYQALNGGDFLYPEAPNDDWYAAFGAISKANPGISNNITGFTIANYAGVGISSNPIILVLSSSNSADYGWNTMHVKATDGASGGLGTVDVSFNRTARSNYTTHTRLQDQRSTTRYYWSFVQSNPSASDDLQKLWTAIRYQSNNTGSAFIKFT